MTTIPVVPRVAVPNITWCKKCKGVRSFHWHKVRESKEEVEEHLRCDTCGGRYGEKHVG